MRQQYFNQINRKQLNGPTAAVVRYDEQNDRAPQLVAQGTGDVARKIIETAKKNDIHLQEDESLVSHLLDIDLGDSIPPQLYTVIAEILLLLEELDKQYE